MGIQDFIKAGDKRQKKSLETEEKEIEDKFCKYAIKKKCKALKLVYLHGKGFPDRTIICPGSRVFFIEFKKKGKKQTQTQIVCQRLLESFGFEYYVCDQIGQAEQILDNFLAFDE